jgi:hypothetical protein
MRIGSLNDRPGQFGFAGPKPACQRYHITRCKPVSQQRTKPPRGGKVRQFKLQNRHAG